MAEYYWRVISYCGVATISSIINTCFVKHQWKSLHMQTVQKFIQTVVCLISMCCAYCIIGSWMCFSFTSLITLFQNHQCNLTEKVTDTGSLRLEWAVVAECATHGAFNQESGYREQKNHRSRVFTFFLPGLGKKYARLGLEKDGLG